MEVTNEHDAARGCGKAARESGRTFRAVAQIILGRVERIPMGQAVTEEAALQLESSYERLEEIEYTTWMAVNQTWVRLVA